MVPYFSRNLPPPLNTAHRPPPLSASPGSDASSSRPLVPPLPLQLSSLSMKRKDRRRERERREREME